MITVGVQEPRQCASELLRYVGAGEPIEVTDGGGPVAVLALLPSGSPLEPRQAGEITPARGDHERAPATSRVAALRAAVLGPGALGRDEG